MTEEETSVGYKIYEKVATDAGGNIAFAFIGVGIIWLVERIFPTAARVLFWIAAGVMGLSVIHFTVVTLSGVIASWQIERSSRRWLWGAQGARLVELILCLTALWLAARVVGYWK